MGLRKSSWHHISRKVVRREPRWYLRTDRRRLWANFVIYANKPKN